MVKSLIMDVAPKIHAGADEKHEIEVIYKKS